MALPRRKKLPTDPLAMSGPGPRNQLQNEEFIEDEYGEQRRSGANRLSREWVHQGGYSMRGPMPHIHAEVQSSQRKEEEKYSKLIAEKREAGRNFALSGGSHVLGAGSSSSMREARQKMVRGLEADPRHRKAAEKRQAAEDHKKARLQKEEERLQALRQRQQEEAVQNQHVNDAKRLRWQVWDMENAPPEASTQVSDHELVGTWSSQKTVYKIRNAMGDLQFNGPPLDQGGDLKGILTRQGPAEWKAELYDSLRNQTVGFMRFRLQGQELVTSFKKLTSNSWGKEKRSQKQPAATKPCDQTRAPMRTNYTEQLIDDSVWQCPQCTLINEDPLCAACGYFIADMQSSQNVDQDGMAGMAAESAEYRLEAEIETKFSCWLRENGLEEYAERLEEHGYSDLDDLLSAEPRDLEEMLRHIEAKPGHILRFKNSLRRTREALS